MMMFNKVITPIKDIDFLYYTSDNDEDMAHSYFDEPLNSQVKSIQLSILSIIKFYQRNSF